MASIIASLLPSLISAGGAIGSSIFGRNKNQETPIQGQQRQLIDQLLASIGGQGPYSDLFNLDESTFQKSFVDPMKQKFQSQIAPQIQQSFISSGQQRGTGLDDTLTRAGVDMDQLLNQQYAQMQESAMGRQSNILSKILGMKPGAQEEQSIGSAALEGLSGLLGNKDFGSMLGGAGAGIGDLLRSFSGPGKNSLQDVIKPPRKGFEREQQVYNPYTGIQE
jgi:hypothetical protein